MKTLTFTVDPTEHFLSTNHDALMAACGLIPGWALFGLDEGLQAHMESTYQYGPLTEMSGCTVNKDGVYQSPYDEDPDLYPLLHVRRGDDEMYQYQYGIVAFKNGSSWFVTRMD